METKIVRNTKETQIELALSGESRQRTLDIGCGFLAHMLDLLCHRAALGITVAAGSGGGERFPRRNAAILTWNWYRNSSRAWRARRG